MSNRTPNDYRQLIELAQSYLDGGERERGIALLQQASELAGEGGEPIQQSAILNKLALEQERAGQGKTARETLLHSLKLLRHANALNEVMILNNIGLIERNLGNLEAAIKYYETILVTLADIDEPFEKIRALTNLGLVYKDQNKLTQAHAYVQDALTLLDDPTVAVSCEQKEQGCRATVLSALSLILEQLHDFQQTRDCYLKAQAAYEQVEDYENQAITLHNLGQIYENQSKEDLSKTREYFIQAFECYFQSLTLNLAYDYKLGEAENLSAIAGLVGEVNQIQQTLNQQSDNPLSNIPLNCSDFIAAWVQVVKEALAELNPSAPTKDLNLILALAQTDNPNQMRQVYEQILNLHRKIDYPVGQMKTLVNLGYLSRDAQQLEEAKNYFTQALVLAENIGSPGDLYEIYLEMGEIHMMIGRVPQAIEDYAAAIEAAESIRARLLLEEEALDYFAWPNLAAYERLVRIEASRGHSKQALLWAEQAKSREFLRRLRLSDVTRSQGVPQELIDREMQLVTQLREAATLLEATDKPDRLSALRKYEAAEQALREVWDEMEPVMPEYVALRQGKPVSWDELQQCLQP